MGWFLLPRAALGPVTHTVHCCINDLVLSAAVDWILHRLLRCCLGCARLAPVVCVVFDDVIGSRTVFDVWCFLLVPPPLRCFPLL